MKEEKGKIRVGISQGDINGIGFEVMLKTLADNRINELCTPIIYGSVKVANQYKKLLDLPELNFNQIAKANACNPTRVNIINGTDEDITITPGESLPKAGKWAFQALEQATEDMLQGEIDVLVTAPINKENMQSEQFKFPGHTEYLQTRSNAKQSLMLMVCDDIRIGVATGHIPLKEVSNKLSEKMLLDKLSLFNDALIKDFGITKPRIAVLGLNPHAGDGGVIGDEETNLIIPAIRKAFDAKIYAFGPFPADGFFGSAEFQKYDGVLAMYHDQGLIPFKTMSFERGVNYTAGLSFIRTSPGHGTAYDIAGKNIASADSFREALFLGLSLFKNRKRYLRSAENPLKTGIGNKFASSEDDVIE